MPGILNPNELDYNSYLEYCQMYMTDHIHENIESAFVSYADISKLINSLGLTMYEKLTTESGKIIVLNKIHQSFKRVDIDISREFLYGLINHLAQYSHIVSDYYKDI